MLSDGQTGKYWLIIVNDLCGKSQWVFRTSTKYAYRKLRELQRIDAKAELKKLTKAEFKNLIGPQQ
jgi:hypothetical protein